MYFCMMRLRPVRSNCMRASSCLVPNKTNKHGDTCRIFSPSFRPTGKHAS